jgi:hypothetical protein
MLGVEDYNFPQWNLWYRKGCKIGGSTALSPLCSSFSTISLYSPPPPVQRYDLLSSRESLLLQGWRCERRSLIGNFGFDESLELRRITRWLKVRSQRGQTSEQAGLGETRKLPDDD